jgi:NADH pyrophosphatase NudC (nudix superfamily)
MNITALREKIGAITEEQEKELAAALEAKDISALEAFCKKHGIELAADEKNVAAEYFKTGKLPLSDQELENVAGGGCSLEFEKRCPFCGLRAHYGEEKNGKKYRVCKNCGAHFTILS